MAQTFFPITPVKVTPGTAGSWQDVDVTAHLGADAGSATGVILHIVNIATDKCLGLRKNGSTDDRHSDMRGASHLWAMIGIDSSDIFEAYLEDITAAQDIYLVGYTKAGVTFKTNADDKSLAC